ncbi:Cytochrome P450 9e2 [Papilio xuthus]|uniref:unspecific monooxygenase n=1 Tax=Papilio xuthus TaxID=66420 RepID=A0A194QDQ3_PAPXU|nr:Cytochrome P450 9e2 [Papilio xuthus]
MTWLMVIVVACSLYLWNVYSKFSKVKIKHLKPFPLLGNMSWILLRREHFAEAMARLYTTFPEERFLGWFEILNPLIMLKDIELIKKICVKDFEHFLDHRSFIDAKADPFFGRNLLLLKGEEWKDMRSTLSPAFTSSKMRLMVPFMVEVGDIMIKSLKERIQSSKDGYIDIDCRDLTTRYANDVIASCAFGFKVDSHTDRDNEFYKMGRVVANFDSKQMLRLMFMLTCPTVSKMLKISLFNASTIDFFRKLVVNTVNEREAKQIVRPDMIHLLMEAKIGKLTHEEKTGADADIGFATVEESSVGRKKVSRVWTDDDLVAQALIFFFAGFDTVSTAMMFALHELAMNPDVQNRLFDEIKQHEVRNGGTLDYNSIQNMNYLDMVVSEVLRKWPPAIGLDRQCLMDYNLGKPNKDAAEDFIIRKGQTVTVPVSAIHRDPALYPDPDMFDPERFSKDNKHLIKPFTYMPFGLGPRNCIGSRFALCELKVLLYQVVRRVQLAPCEKTCVPAKLATDTFNIRLKGGHWLRFRLRE